MTSIAHAEWTKVNNSVNGDTIYVDLERIKKHDGKFYYWFLAEVKPNEHGIVSFTTYTEAECGRFRYRDLTSTYYEGPMGSGTIILDVNTPEKEWRYPKPNTSAEFALKSVCKHKP
jgi:hypothetical protein